MKKSTRILLIIYILFLIPSIILGGSIFQSVKILEGKIFFEFGTKSIIALVLVSISVVIGIILYFKFLSSLTIDKMLFFLIMPLFSIYGILIFLLAQLNFMDNDFANTIKSFLNISTENFYNTVLWAVLISIVFILVVYFTFIFACKPINKVEKVISRLGDGKLKEEKLIIGGGKQFNNIEHGLNKINNNYKEKDNSLKQFNLKEEKFISKQFFRFLGKNLISELEMGRNVTKKAFLLHIKLEEYLKKDMTTLNEEYKILSSYLKVISPLICRFNGFIDKYWSNCIVAVFSKSENALKCANSVIRALEIHNKQWKKDFKIKERISIISDDLVFGVVDDGDRKIPTIISNTTNKFNKFDKISQLFSLKLLFTKDIIDDLPLNYKMDYRYIGSLSINEKEEMLFECISLYSRRFVYLLRKNKRLFEKAVMFYNEDKFIESFKIFSYILKIVPEDKVSYLYLNKIKEKINVN